MAFGALIRKHRRLKGLMLKQISAPLGVSAAYWCRIEQDAGTPPRDALIVQAAAILGVPEDEAFVAAGRLPLDIRVAQAVNLSLETLVEGSPKAVAEGLPAPETDVDAHFFRDYLALSKEDRKRFRQVCELAFGAASSEKPAQEAQDVRRRKPAAAAR